MRRLQRGQAMVLIALMIVALCGMLGLAIDSGRAFVDRRAMQNSADAAAVAGAVTYIRQQSYGNAETTMLDVYQKNRVLSGGACIPSIPQTPPAGGSVSLACTFTSDHSQGLTMTVTNYAPPSSFDEFTATGSQSLLTAIIQIAGGANTVPITASGCAATWDSSTCAAVPPVVLATSGLCGSGGDALNLKGNGGAWPVVVGNVGSFGDTHQEGTPNIAGDTTYYCGSGPSVNSLCYPTGGALGGGCAYPTSSFHTGKPPIYNIPPASGDSTVQTTSGLGVNLAGGTYTNSSATVGPGQVSGSSNGSINFGGAAGNYTNGCYFLPAGVYKFSGVNAYIGGGVFSNELRPPDEPNQTSSDHSVVMPSAQQFWNMNHANCAGTFTLTAAADTTGGIALPVGAYAFRLTSVRTTDNNVTRESGPSACKTINVGLPGQGVTVAVSNVPGAQDYNVYMSSAVLSAAAADGDLHAGTCQGKFYQVSSIPVQDYVNETNANTNGCPSTVVPSPVTSVNATCTLGASAQTDDLCIIYRAEYRLGVIAAVQPGCTTLLNSVPDVPPQPAVTCNAAAALAVPPPPGLPNYSVASACTWPGPIQFKELLAPAGGSVLPDQDPAVGYEIGNWGACESALAGGGWGAADSCPNTATGYVPDQWLTPGAVQLQTDAGDCVVFNGGMPFIFSGYQNDWGLIVHSGSPTCSDQLTPVVGSEFIGHYYGPQGSVTVTGTSSYVPTIGPQAPTVYGCVIAAQPTVDGSNGLAVYFVTPTSAILITGYGIPTGSGC